MSWSSFLSAEASYLSAPEDMDIPQRDITGQGFMCETDDCPNEATIDFNAYGDDYPDWMPYGCYCETCGQKKLDEVAA